MPDLTFDSKNRLLGLGPKFFSGSGRLGNRFQLKLRTLPLKIISSRSLKASTENCFYRRRNSFFSPMPVRLTRCDATALFKFVRLSDSNNLSFYNRVTDSNLTGQLNTMMTFRIVLVYWNC